MEWGRLAAAGRALWSRMEARGEAAPARLPEPEPEPEEEEEGGPEGLPAWVEVLLDLGTPAILRWGAGRLIADLPRNTGSAAAAMIRALLEVRSRLDAMGAGGSRVDPLLDEDPGRALAALRAELEATIAMMEGGSSPTKRPAGEVEAGEALEEGVEE